MEDKTGYFTDYAHFTKFRSYNSSFVKVLFKLCYSFKTYNNGEIITELEHNFEIVWIAKILWNNPSSKCFFVCLHIVLKMYHVNIITFNYIFIDFDNDLILQFPKRLTGYDATRRVIMTCRRQRYWFLNNSIWTNKIDQTFFMLLAIPLNATLRLGWFET